MMSTACVRSNLFAVIICRTTGFHCMHVVLSSFIVLACTSVAGISLYFKWLRSVLNWFKSYSLSLLPLSRSFRPFIPHAVVFAKAVLRLVHCTLPLSVLSSSHFLYITTFMQMTFNSSSLFTLSVLTRALPTLEII